MALNRLDEAKATIDDAEARKLDQLDVRREIYHWAFLQNNSAMMEEQVAWAKGSPGAEDAILAEQSFTEVYHGRLRKARELARLAEESAKRNDAKEVAANYVGAVPLWEAEFGNSGQARQEAENALAAFPEGRNVRVQAASALALAGDASKAQKLVDQLSHDFPLDTIMQGYWLPTIRGAIELRPGRATEAIERLQAASSYELGGDLLFSYIRGQAYLVARNGNAAAAEFQKLLDHRGIVRNSPVGALAHLQFGRAYALSGDKTKARAAYQDFFALWKDADPDIPILKEAKAEYAKLQ
jgi:predicted Zn-dependent protease